MKGLSVVLALLWLAASTYAGYRLTERSFAWIDQPNFGIVAPTKTAAPSAAPAKTSGTTTALPKAGQDPVAWFKSLTPLQQGCLVNALGQARLQTAAITGNFVPTAAESVKIAACLK